MINTWIKYGLKVRYSLIQYQNANAVALALIIFLCETDLNITNSKLV
jgi:hypothetical protein